jgi:hypothetical protein
MQNQNISSGTIPSGCFYVNDYTTSYDMNTNNKYDSIKTLNNHILHLQHVLDDLIEIKNVMQHDNSFHFSADQYSLWVQGNKTIMQGLFNKGIVIDDMAEVEFQKFENQTVSIPI